MATHGKKYGKRDKLNNKLMSEYTEKSVEIYYANVAEVKAAYDKAIYAAEKGYKEFLRDLENSRDEGYETARRQLELKETK